jgi:hypothetical protein
MEGDAMASVRIDELTLADEPERWAQFGFEVWGDRCRLGDVDVRLAGDGSGGGITRWKLRGIESEELDGLPTRTSSSSETQGTAPTHPNGVIRIDHVVAISPAFERSVARLQDAGLDLRRVREEPTPAGAPRQAFFRLGAEILEMVAEPDEVTERAGGPDRPVIFWGLALLTEDLEATAAAFAPHSGDPRPAVQPGRRIAAVKRSAGLCAPVALITPVEDTHE